MRKTKHYTVYLNPPLEAALKSTIPPSRRLGMICDRYAEIVRRARIPQRFEPAELGALADCSGDKLYEPAQLIDGAVLAAFADAARDGLCQKWQIDYDTTVAKLRDLAYHEQVALAEEIERRRDGQQ